MSDVALDFGGRRGPRTAILIAVWIASASLGGFPESAARADTFPLNTGVVTRNGGEGVVDALWRVSHEAPGGGSIIDEGVKIVTGTDSPLHHEVVGATASHWVAAARFGGGEAAESTYYTKFKLTTTQAASASIDALWRSDGDTVEVTLNGDSVFSGGAGANALEAWHDLRIGVGAGFQAGVNVLEFRVRHHRRDSGDPIGFRLVGDVSFPSTVPEPATLVLSTVSTLILAGLSWKRRLSRSQAD